jgi:polysaccharide biosynthesis transport protein
MDAKNNDYAVQALADRPGGTGSASSQNPTLSVAEIIVTLRRERRFLILGCLVGLVLAIGYVALVPTLYKSSARILLDRSITRYLQANKIADDPTFDDAEIASQIYILSSENIAIPVVQSMNLAHDNEFVGPGGGPIDAVKNFVKSLIGWDNHADPLVDSEAARGDAAVENFLKRLSVYREDVANVISVTFASEDPTKAANIANAIADTYIATALETKLKSTKMVSQWLQDRLVELKLQATDADRALQDYKIANNLVNTGKGLLSTDQLEGLNTQLTNARTTVTEARTRLDSLRQVSTQGITGAAATDTLIKLRSEYRDLAARASDLGVAPTNIAAVRLQKKMDEVQASIHDEEQRIIDSYNKEYQVAKARENDLAAAAAKLYKEVGTNNQALVKMRELESSADTLRSIYNSFLQKFNEINTIQTETIPVQSARILTRAVPGHKNSKKIAAVLAGGILAGLLLGAGAAVGKEWAADVLRTAKQVEAIAGAHCVVLPKITPRQQPDMAQNLIEEFVLEAPFSRFTETLRDVKAHINVAQLVDRGVKIVGVVSSVPHEGKTTVAANLAALMVVSSGARTLIIDSDIHLARLTAQLAPDAKVGLIEALADPVNFAKFVHHRPNSGLDVLPCPLPDRLTNAAELLGSARMGQLLVAARQSYDYVVIEIAPIMSVVDIKMIERFVDAFIFVVEWGQTKRVVSEALSEAHIIRERLLSIVLNKVDATALRTIESYKGDRYKDYYQQ